MRQLEIGNSSSLDQLHINIRWLKEWKRASIDHLHGGVLPYSTFWLVLSGSGEIKFGQTVCKLRKHDIVSLPAQSMLQWISMSSETPFHYLSLACEAKVGTFDLLRLYGFPLQVNLLDEQAFLKLVRRWFELSDHFHSLLRHFDQFELKSTDPREGLHPGEYPFITFNTPQTAEYLKIRALGNMWFHHLFEALEAQLPLHPRLYDTRVYEVIEYVNSHLHERPTLDQLAGIVSLSKEQLRFLFQKQIGVPPMKFVASARHQRARELLLLSSDPMMDIAGQLGFQDQHHFSRTFHQAEGIAPSDYRKKLKGRIASPLDGADIGVQQVKDEDRRERLLSDGQRI